MAKHPMSVEQIAAQVWTHCTRDGTVIFWHQEDENAVQTREEAIAMVQRTINFWAVKLIDDLQTQQHMTQDQATTVARKTFRTNIHNMAKAAPFAQRWGFTVEDFIFP